MAATRWFMFHEAIRGHSSGNYNLGAANKWQMVLVSSAGAATQPTLELSTTASLSGIAALSAIGDDDTGITRTLANVLLTATTGGLLRWSFDSVVFTATAGSDFSAKYAAILYSAVAVPFAVCVLSTGGSVVANQITVTCPADGALTFGNEETQSVTYSLA